MAQTGGFVARESSGRDWGSLEWTRHGAPWSSPQANDIVLDTLLMIGLPLLLVVFLGLERLGTWVRGGHTSGRSSQACF